MKFIRKGSEPISFANWKKDNPNAKYGDLIGEPKKDLRKSLMNEQHSICCYCECRIKNEDTNPYNSFHIEHFKPKGDPLYSAFQLDYSNLLASCGISFDNLSDLE